jgi:hypothetical protein
MEEHVPTAKGGEGGGGDGDGGGGDGGGGEGDREYVCLLPEVS